MLDLWQDNLICEKEAVVLVFFLKRFETYGSEVVCERIRLNIIAHAETVRKPGSQETEEPLLR